MLCPKEREESEAEWNLCNVTYVNFSHPIWKDAGISLISLTESSPDEERAVWCRKRVVTFWEVKNIDMVSELKHTHTGFLSLDNHRYLKFYTHQPIQSWKENRNRLMDEWIISPHALVAFCFTEMWHISLVIPSTAASALWELAVSIFSLFRAWLLILRVGRRHVFFGSRLVWIRILAAALWVIKN